jgi:chromosome segregation ATPase
MTTEANTEKLEVTSDDNNEVVTVPSTSEEKPSPEPVMLTKEQAEKLANDRHSKLDKKIAELTKNSERLQKSILDAETRTKKAYDSLSVAQKRVEEAERKSLGDSPDALKLFEAQVKHRQEVEKLEQMRSEFESEKVKYTEDISEAKQYKITRLADTIASEYGVDASLLTTLTDGSQEKMELLAKSLPKKDEGKGIQLPGKPDSGKHISGVGNPTIEQLDAMPMDKYAEWAAKRNKK